MKKTTMEYPQSYYGLLSILTLGPQSGYDIRKSLDDPEMFYWTESFGNIYPMLRVIEKDGLISKRDAYVKRKKRVIYELNESGWRELNAWLAEPARLSRFRVEILMKLRFGSSCGVDNMIEQIAAYRDSSAWELDATRDHCRNIGESGESLTNDLRCIASLFLLHLKESAITWCDESLKILEKWKNREIDPEGLLPDIARTSDHFPGSGETTVVSMPTKIVPLIE